MDVLINYILFPIFLFLICLKGLSEDYWPSIKLKDLLLSSLADTIVVILFIPLYLIRRKTFHKKLLLELVNNAFNFSQIDISNFQLQMKKHTSITTQKFDSIESPYCYLATYRSLTEVDFDKNQTDVFNAVSDLKLDIENNDYKKISNDYLKQFFSGLRYTSPNYFYYGLMFQFEAPNIDESVTVHIKSKDFNQNSYHTLAYYFNYIKFITGTLLPNNSFCWVVERYKGFNYMEKRHYEFKRKHGLHESDSIYSWINKLPDTPQNSAIRSVWRTVQDDITSHLSRDERIFNSYKSAESYISQSLNRLIDLNNYNTKISN